MLKELQWSKDKAASMVTDAAQVLAGMEGDEERGVFLCTLVTETRSMTLENVRQHLLDFFDREAWKAAVRWSQMRASRGTWEPSVYRAMCNAALGSALSLVATWSVIQTDDWEHPDYYMLGVGDDGCAVPLVLDDVARRKDMV